MEVIKILYCADIHGDSKALELFGHFAVDIRPNLIICNGDIAGTILSDEEKEAMAEFEQYREALHNGERKITDTGLESKAEAIIQSNRQRKGKMYKSLREILDAVSEEVKCPYVILSGEHDTLKQKGGVFSDRLLDYRSMSRQASKTSFAGVPGGIIIPGQEPDFIPYPFEEMEPDAFKGPKQLKDMLMAPSGVISRPYKALTEMDPDIAVVHVPPFGIFEDESKSGSKGLADYINESVPNLVLCAHTHNYGIRRWDSETNRETVVVNPGNLGAVYGCEGNTFAVILLDGLNYVMAAQILKQLPPENGESELQILEEFVR